MGRRLRVDDLYALAIPSAPALAPAGDRVVYALRTPDRSTDTERSSLWLVEVAGGEPARLTYGGADTAPAWSPNGSSIAFLRDEGAGPQMWIMPATGGEGWRLSSLPLGSGRPVWSPDGSRIAVSAPVDGADGDEHGPIVIDRLGYKADGVGPIGNRRRHLLVLDVDRGAARQITSGDWDAGDPAWSPDGTRLTFSAARTPVADLTLCSEVYVVDVDQPGPPRQVGPSGCRFGAVCWTPDGRGVIAVGQLVPGAGNAGLMLLSLDGGPVRELTAAFDRNVMPGAPAYPGGLPAIVDGGRAVVVCVRDRGCTQLWRVDLDGGSGTRLVATPTTVVSGLSVAAGLAAVVVADPLSYGEIGVVDVSDGELRVLTGYTREALPDVDLFLPEEREVEVADGTLVHGWLIRDPAAKTPAPLVLDVHGGPHNAWHPAADAAHLYHQVLAAQGIAVLIGNPRGSDGYGERFRTAALGAWGLADEADLLGMVEALVDEGIADPARLGVCGYSYGGFMTCHLTGRTDRFAAAVAGGVVADLTSLVGTSIEGHELAAVECRAFPHTNAAVLREQSPIERVGRVRTPTLILHGLADEACPVGQAEQWFTALRELGVPARMVLYPGAAHSFIVDGRPSQRADYGTRLVDWMRRYLIARSGQHPHALPPDAEHWQRRLEKLAAVHGVPGATLGILRVRPGAEDEVLTAASGVLSAETEVPVTPDSVFQIGSITKVWTATMIMGLVDAGRLDLDAPVIDVLSELRLVDGELTERLTMRHLLTHTSGIDGDIFDDTGRGDDCVEKYVAQLRSAGVNHPLGATFSYCNSGYVIAGRVVEVLTGTSWDQAIRERLFAPLGLRHTGTLPEDALLHRAAVGHLAEPGEEPHPAGTWTLPRSVGPAGLIWSSVVDLLTFARMHLADGLAKDGTRLLSRESAVRMRDKHADLPDIRTLGDSWGLGWIRYGWDGARLVGHDGGTLGQAAFLRVLPDHGIAVGLLTNGGRAQDLYRELAGEVVAELAGITMPDGVRPSEPPPDLDVAAYVGRYERAAQRVDILARDGSLVLRDTLTGPLAELVDIPSHEYELSPVDKGVFAMREPGAVTWRAVTFYRLPDGSPYLHSGGRATPKVS